MGVTWDIWWDIRLAQEKEILTLDYHNAQAQVRSSTLSSSTPSSELPIMLTVYYKRYCALCIVRGSQGWREGEGGKESKFAQPSLSNSGQGTTFVPEILGWTKNQM